MESCSKCYKNFDPTLLYTCDGCKKILCTNCSGLVASEIKVMTLRNKRTLKFLCPACEEGLAKIPELVKDISDIKTMLLNMQNERNTVDNPAFEMEEIINEMTERQRRANNVLIFNVNESSTANRSDRTREEINTVKGILTHAEKNLGSFKVMRIGKYTAGKTRPLKVMFETREEAVKILKNRQQIIGKISNLRIYGDQTTKQRDYYKFVKNKLESIIASGDNTKIIKYINGVPQIVNKDYAKNS